MGSLGLLGALGGLGKAMEDMGSDIVRRREQALEWARQEAKYQRERVDKKEDTKDAYAQALTMQSIKDTEAGKRAQALIDAKREDAAADREFKTTERVAKETAAERRIRLEVEGQKEVAKLRASLQKSVNADEIRLREKLDANDIKRLEYGKPNKEGYAKVKGITADGKIIDLDEEVYKPKLDYADPFDEEEEE